VIAAAVLASLVAASAPPAVFALHIGVNVAPEGSGLAPLRFADDDAARLAGLTRAFTERTELLATLDDLSQRRFPDAARSARPPTAKEVERAVERLRGPMRLARARGQRVVLLFSYSGHGTRADGGGTDLTLLDGKLDRAFLEGSIAGLPADAAHLWLDACYAGGLVQDRGFTEREASGRRLNREETDVALGLDFFQRHPHVGALIAASADGPSHEWSTLEAGVFTYELVSGLHGAADVNLDGVVDYSELGAFVAAANRAIPDPRARVALEVEPPRQNQREPLIDRGWLQRGALLSSTAQPGHLSVARADGLRLLDAHPGPDQPLTVWLPAGGELLVTRAVGAEGTALRARVTPTDGQEIALSRLLFRPAPTISRRGDSLDAALQQGFFGKPYSRAYYEGYADSRELVPVTFDASAVVAQAPPRPTTTETATPAAPTLLTDEAAGVDDLYNKPPPAPTPRPQRPQPRAEQLSEDDPAVAAMAPKDDRSARPATTTSGSPLLSAAGWAGAFALASVGALGVAPALLALVSAASTGFEASLTRLPARQASMQTNAIFWAVFGAGSVVIITGLFASAAGVWWLTRPAE
jgi:hypothetical protein